MFTKTLRQHYWILAPLIGIIIFAILYLIAAHYYPGGSQIDKGSKGFDWAQNYWCDLLSPFARNGGLNTCRPIALAAMGVLCLSLGIFWYGFAQLAGLQKTKRLITQIAGILSMVTCVFLFTGFHDLIINIASLFGCIATAGTLYGLWELRWIKLFWWGIFNLSLVAINNILYYTPGMLFYLPVVQKITFLFFLLWMGRITINLFWHAGKVE